MARLIPYVDGAVDTGRRKSAAYADGAAGLLPTPIKVGSRSYMLDTEVDAIVRARVAGKSDAEIRELVAQLHAARASGGAA